MKPSETLKRAAEKIERDGWRKDFYAIGSTTCAIGAIGAVSSGATTEDGVVRAALALHGKEGRHPLLNPLSEVIGGLSIASWNDAKDQTKENVILTLKLAALHAELDEQEQEKRNQLASENAWALVQR